MAHRRPIVAYAADISALALMQCREEHVSPRMMRLEVVNALMNEFAEIADNVTRSLHDHGEVTERCFRGVRERMRDLQSMVGYADMPTGEMAVSSAAD